jgi:hypothetical protein
MAYSATYNVAIKIVLAIFKSTVVKNYNGAMQNLKAKMESGI